MRLRYHAACAWCISVTCARFNLCNVLFVAQWAQPAQSYSLYDTGHQQQCCFFCVNISCRKVAKCVCCWCTLFFSSFILVFVYGYEQPIALSLIEIDKFIYLSGPICSSRIIAYRIPLTCDSFVCGHTKCTIESLFFELIFDTSVHDADINLSFRLTFEFARELPPCVLVRTANAVFVAHFVHCLKQHFACLSCMHFETFLVSN